MSAAADKAYELKSEARSYSGGRKSRDQAPRSLCWFCARACEGTAIKARVRVCSWAQRFQPVKNWKAIYNPIRIGWGNKGERATEFVDSWAVVHCPLYVEDAKRGVSNDRS
jgi:hypothetical protein